jgi:hypothetical protein
LGCSIFPKTNWNYKQPVHADSAYKGEQIEAELKRRGFDSQINEKGIEVNRSPMHKKRITV